MEEKLYSLLLVLASVSFTALVRERRDLPWWGTGFATGYAVLVLDIASTPAHAMLALSLCCALALCKIVHRAIALLLAGAIAAICHARLTERFPLAMEVTLFLLVFPLLFALILKHDAFRDEVMVDEALSVVLVGCLLAGFVPEILQGWSSASSLQGLDEDVLKANESAAGVWLSGTCVLLGILYQRWKYR